MRAKVYVEGGGDRRVLHQALREGFREFFKKAGLKHLPRVVACGSRRHALRSINDQCVVGQSGSLEEAGIREEVCQIMEGGRRAFARRYQRFGREPGDV